MGGAEEEWVKAAMTDDTMVVELLVRLHGAVAPPPPPPPTLPLEWTVRQRRSRPVTVNAKKLAQSQRASPSTPLSWSVATSLSGGSGGAGGGGGSEESSRPNIQNISAATRSKVCIRSDNTYLIHAYMHLYGGWTCASSITVHAFAKRFEFSVIKLFRVCARVRVRVSLHVSGYRYIWFSGGRPRRRAPATALRFQYYPRRSVSCQLSFGGFLRIYHTTPMEYGYLLPRFWKKSERLSFHCWLLLRVTCHRFFSFSNWQECPSGILSSFPIYSRRRRFGRKRPALLGFCFPSLDYSSNAFPLIYSNFIVFFFFGFSRNVKHWWTLLKFRFQRVYGQTPTRRLNSSPLFHLTTPTPLLCFLSSHRNQSPELTIITPSHKLSELRYDLQQRWKNYAAGSEWSKHPKLESVFRVSSFLSSQNSPHLRIN